MDGPKANNEEVLKGAETCQYQSKRAIERIRRQIAESEDVAGNTLNELGSQRAQANRVLVETDRLEGNLEQTKRLQDRFDVLSWSLFGSRRRQAKKRAAMELKATAGSIAPNNHLVVDKGDKKQDPVMQNIKERNLLFGSGGKTSEPRGSRVLKRGGAKVSDDNDNKPAPNNGSNDKGRQKQQQTPLDEECEQRLARIEENDREIDAMLDDIGCQLDRLKFMSDAIKEETECTGAVIETAAGTIERSRNNQAVINARFRNLLNNNGNKKKK